MDSERIWRIVDNHRAGVPRKKRVTGAKLSLSDRLHDIYVECLQSNNDKNADKRFRSAVNLLSRLDKAQARPSLIVNLYEDEKGYSVMLCLGEGGETDEIFMPYEDNEIFSYLDSQEIPPVMMEVLEQTKYCHLYNGRVVCEVRDYRCHSVLAGYEKHLLLLKPTTETLLATVNDLAHQNKCSQEEKLLLEAHLLLATQPPLCLDTTTDVLWVTNRLHYNQRKFYSPSVRRYLRKRCHASRALMQQTADEEAPEGLRVDEFVSDRRSQRRNFSNSWKKPKLFLDTSQLNFDSLAREVIQLAKPVPTNREDLLPSHMPTPQSSPPHHTHPSQISSIADELLQSRPTEITPAQPPVVIPQPSHPPALHSPPALHPPRPSPPSQNSQPPPASHPSQNSQPPPASHPPQILQPPSASYPPQTSKPPSLLPPPPTSQPPRASHPPTRPSLPPMGPLSVPRPPLQMVSPSMPALHRTKLLAAPSTANTPPKLKPLDPGKPTGVPMRSIQPKSQGFVELGAKMSTPPKLNPAPKPPSMHKAAAVTGMPKLHPLTPTPPACKPPVSATITTNPAMPQLHRMPAPISRGPPLGKLSMPSLKPGVITPPKLSAPPQLLLPHTTHSVPPQASQLHTIHSLLQNTHPQLQITHSQSHIAHNVSRAVTTPSPSLASVRPQSGDGGQSQSDTRMPASLTSLSMPSGQQRHKKQSRSAKLISGTKVKSRKKK